MTTAITKTNVDKLNDLGALNDVRQRLGWEEGSTTEFVDARINRMDAREVCRQYCAWHIGDPRWASQIINIYEALK